MKVYIYFDKDDHPIAEGRSAHDLARKLGITPQAVSHGIHRGSDRYMVMEDDDECDCEGNKNARGLQRMSV